MLAYWLLFSIFAFSAINENKKYVTNDNLFAIGLSWYFWVFILTFFIGFRDSIGTDWFPYVRLFNKISIISFQELLTNISYSENISYSILIWISSKLGFGIYGANLLMGFIFSLFLIIFCNHFDRPYFALLISIPYIIVVVGIGYGRQGVALAFLMISFLCLFKNKKILFILLIVAGSTFHKSLIFFLPFLILSFDKNKFILFFLSFFVY